MRPSILLAVICLMGLQACGHKGKLKTPMQAASDEAKKSKKNNSNAVQVEQLTNGQIIEPTPQTEP